MCIEKGHVLPCNCEEHRESPYAGRSSAIGAGSMGYRDTSTELLSQAGNPNPKNPAVREEQLPQAIGESQMAVWGQGEARGEESSYDSTNDPALDSMDNIVQMPDWASPSPSGLSEDEDELELRLAGEGRDAELEAFQNMKRERMKRESHVGRVALDQTVARI